MRMLLCVDDDGRLYMLGLTEINEPWLARIVHEDDADADQVALGSLGVGDGCGPWMAGQFEFFGEPTPQWVRLCAEAAAEKLGEWSAAGRLMRMPRNE